MMPSAYLARGVDVDLSDDMTVGEGAIVSEGALPLPHDHHAASVRRLVFSPLVIETGTFVGARYRS